MISFYINSSLVEIDSSYGTQTVLEFLRENRGLTGTKEGCASGDCGACTVVVVEANSEGDLVYNAINSCITFVGALQGKHLVSVEHLAERDRLHPVQQAMVDCHGSQCGFCTPGFVMSMYSLYQLDKKPEHDEIDEYLAGNLCRCTGYKPIITAMHKACEDRTTAPQSNIDRESIKTQLEDLRCNTSEEKTTNNYLHPNSAAELAQLLATHTEARINAGSTDLALEYTQNLRSFETLIGVQHVPELQVLEDNTDHLRIGAAVTYSRSYDLIKTFFSELASMMLRLGSRQIRNQGTFGGNIANASPIGDTPPVLIALQSELILQSTNGTRSLPIEEFFIDYRKTALRQGEFIREIIVPKLRPAAHLKVYKVSKRLDDDISAVLMAAKITLENGLIKTVRIACGGMAATPKRARNCELAMTGKPLNAQTVAAAQIALDKDFQPIDDVRASAQYRLTVAKNLLTRLRLELTEPNAMTQVSQLA
ncbi:MAG: xanthine dehydrogenase small subunit [Pseudomonadota bacterium]